MEEPLKAHLHSEGTAKVVVFGEYSLIKAGIDIWKAEYLKRSRAMTGSFGVVFRIEVEGIPYYIKRISLKPDEQNEFHKKIISREIRAAIDLTRNVPNAVSNLKGAILIDKPDNSQYQAYLMFEGPPGYNLEEYLRITPAPEYYKLYCSIKSAQVAVNTAGYVHRDIKPANIFVEIDPATGAFIRCKLIDLGFTVPTGSKTGRAGTQIYWPRTMNAANTYASVHQGRAGVYQNNHSVNTIWTEDFKQKSPPPNDTSCMSHSNVKPNPPTVGRPPLVPKSQSIHISNITQVVPKMANGTMAAKRRAWLNAPPPDESRAISPEAEALVETLARAPKGGRKTRVKRRNRTQKKTRVKRRRL